MRLILEPLELVVGIGESVQPDANRGGGRLGEQRGSSSILHLRIFTWYLGLHDFETPMGLDSRPKLQWPDLSSADLPTEENFISFLSQMDEKTSCTCFHTQYVICPS